MNQNSLGAILASSNLEHFESKSVAGAFLIPFHGATGEICLRARATADAVIFSLELYSGDITAQERPTFLQAASSVSRKWVGIKAFVVERSIVAVAEHPIQYLASLGTDDLAALLHRNLNMLREARNDVFDALKERRDLLRLEQAYIRIASDGAPGKGQPRGGGGIAI